MHPSRDTAARSSTRGVRRWFFPRGVMGWGFPEVANVLFLTVQTDSCSLRAIVGLLGADDDRVEVARRDDVQRIADGGCAAIGDAAAAAASATTEIGHLGARGAHMHARC